MGLFRNIKATGELDELRDQVTKLRREFQALELDWTNAYDKLRMMMQRIAKRAEVAEKLQPSNGVDQEAEAPDDPALPGRLTPAQRRIQQAILKQRAGL